MLKRHIALSETIVKVDDPYEQIYSATCADCGETITKWYFIDDDHATWTKWHSKESGNYCKAEVTKS